MKTLTLRIKEPELCKELDAIKAILDEKSDAKTIKLLIQMFRKKETELNELILKNNDLRTALQAEKQLKNNFTEALKNYIK